MKKGHLTLKIISLIVLSLIIESFADLFFKKGLLKTGIDSVGFSNLFEFVSRNFFSLYIWLGVSMYLVNFIIWLTVLHKVQLSHAFPVSSVGYIFVPVLAIMFLHETVPLLRWAGIALIMAGIYSASKSSRMEGV